MKDDEETMRDMMEGKGYNPAKLLIDVCLVIGIIILGILWYQAS